MLIQFKYRWNKTCDMLDSIVQSSRNSKIKHRIMETKLYKQLQCYFIQTTPMLYHFIRNCSNYNIAVLSINNTTYSLDYSTRRSLVYSFAMLNKYIRRKSFIKSYITLSLLFCRENFNFTQYKFLIASPEHATSKQPISKV